MKNLVILGICLLISFYSSSQSLQGEWKGYLTDNSSTVKSAFALFFALNKDSSYSIYSYSKVPNNLGDEVLTVCEVSYKIISADSICLEETRQIKPKRLGLGCFQKFSLKINNSGNGLTLVGTWTTEAKGCMDHGSVSLSKTK